MVNWDGQQIRLLLKKPFWGCNQFVGLRYFLSILHCNFKIGFKLVEQFVQAVFFFFFCVIFSVHVLNCSVMNNDILFGCDVCCHNYTIFVHLVCLVEFKWYVKNIFCWHAMQCGLNMFFVVCHNYMIILANCQV